MTSFEELQRIQDTTIAFYKNRLDLALAHQKEMTALFFKVTIGYFAIVYGIFLIYKILYDTHFQNVDLFLHLVLFFFSISFFLWALHSFAMLYILDHLVQGKQKILDQVLHYKVQTSHVYVSAHSPSSVLTHENLHENLDESEAFRESTFENNSQILFHTLIGSIIIVPFVLFVYTLVQMPRDVLFFINIWELKLGINWFVICCVFVICLLFISMFITSKQFNYLESKKNTNGKT